jgi:DNA-binding NtrC family response regulator
MVTISDEAMEVLQNHHWEGNVRQLKGVVERACHIVNEGTITPEYISFAMSDGSPRHLKMRSEAEAQKEGKEEFTPDLPFDLPGFKKIMIEKALAENNNNYAAAARALGLSESALRVRKHRKKK